MSVATCAVEDKQKAIKVKQRTKTLLREVKRQEPK